MICTNCIRGPSAIPNRIQPQTLYPSQPIFSQQRMVYQAQPTYQMLPSTSQPIIYRWFKYGFIYEKSIEKPVNIIFLH